MFGAILGAIAPAVLGGLFQNKANRDARKNAPTPEKNLLSQAQGAREAAAKYGFNPLTMMQYGQTGGASSGGAPVAPLASVEMLTSALKDVSDVTSGDAARRRAADELEIDLARLKVEQARSGVIVHPQNVTDTVGPGLSPIGRATSTVGVRASAPAPRRFGALENPVAPGRKKEVTELTNAPGVFEIENAVTGGTPVTIPGDGEPWGIDELATAVIVGAPQVFNNTVGGGKSLGERFKKRWTPHEDSIISRARRWWNGDDDEKPSKKGKR